MNKEKIIASIMLLASAIFWGMSYSIQSIMAGSLGTYSVIFLKGFSGYLLIIYCLIFKRKFDKKTVLSGILIGTFNGIGLLLQQKGLSLSTVSKTSFISGLYIIIVPIIQMFTKVRPKKTILVSCCNCLYWNVLLMFEWKL